MKKIFLYLNTLSYLSFKQIIFLVYNKIIKKYFFGFFLLSNSKRLFLKNRHDFQIIRDRINKIFGGVNLWSLGVDKSEEHSAYFEELKVNILQFAENANYVSFKELWIEKKEDVELNFNYQRFYLFKEVFDEINLSDKKQIQLILIWIKFNEKSQLAWSGFNCAMRLINWMKILQNIDKNEIQIVQWNVIEDSIYKQYLFNSNNIDFHIPSNHIALQYYSTWLITHIFLKWNESLQRKEITKEILLKEFEVEFLNNGLHFELSSHYHLQITLLGLSMIFQFGNIGEKIPVKFNKIIHKAVCVLEQFFIGDYYPTISDGCYNFFHENKKQDLQNVKYLKNKFINNFNSKGSLVNIDNSYLFMQNNLFKIIFDTGDISLKSTPGHGHADILSIILGYNDIPILIDPGTYQYRNSKESLRLKKTSFHNTISIDNEDQAKLWGFFRWAYLPEKIQSGFRTLSKNKTLLYGEFLGYRHLGGITHKRLITNNFNEILIEDSLEGKLGKYININFILHPKIIVHKEGNVILLKSKLNDFKLKCSNQSVHVSVEQIMIFDNYNTGTNSKKITFTFSNSKMSKFESKILFEVLN